MKNSFTKLFFIAILALVMITGIVLYNRDSILKWFDGNLPAAYSAAQVRLGEVRKGEIVVSVTAAGTAYSAKSTAVSAPYNGYVKKVFVKIGDQVKTGDPILSVAESTMAKDEEIYPLLASFKGTIVEVNVSPGEQVKGCGGNDAKSDLIRIEDFSSFYILAELPELDYVKVKKNLAAKIKISAIIDKTFNGEIINLNLASKSQDRWDRNKVVFPVKISLNEHDSRLRPGMSALVDIIVASKKDALLLEHEFIEEANGEYYVTTEHGDRIQVRIGLQNEMVAEITDGLFENQKIRQVDFLAGGSSL